MRSLFCYINQHKIIYFFHVDRLSHRTLPLYFFYILHTYVCIIGTNSLLNTFCCSRYFYFTLLFMQYLQTVSSSLYLFLIVVTGSWYLWLVQIFPLLPSVHSLCWRQCFKIASFFTFVTSLHWQQCFILPYFCLFKGDLGNKYHVHRRYRCVLI